VFYRIQLSQRELVYVDTFGSSFDTLVAVVPWPCTGTPTCQDDACGGSQSQLAVVLDPGAYAVVVERGAGAGTAFILNVQHVPVGAGAASQLNAGMFTVMGDTSAGATDSPGSCGSAPDQWYYWLTCPADLGGTLAVSSCGGATWDTVLQLRNGAGGGGGCDDDSPCGIQSQLSAQVAAGAGLHVLFVDGKNASTGPFTVSGTRP
jgi:hypothetical protein